MKYLMNLYFFLINLKKNLNFYFKNVLYFNENFKIINKIKSIFITINILDSY